MAEDLVIKLSEEFTWIGNAFRGRLLDEADSEGETVARAFDQAVELGAGELTLLLRTKEKRVAFADHGVAFSLAPALSGSAVEFPHAFVERVDPIGREKVSARAGGPSPFV
jgi:hypothetical protein